MEGIRLRYGVEPARLAAAVAIGGAAFFLLFGYEAVRSASTSLFVAHYGADGLPWVMALSPVGTAAMLYGYGLSLTRLGARRTLTATSLVSATTLALCWGGLALADGVLHGPVSALLYVLREGYIVLIIEQYWSFINSTLRPTEAKRVNGPICGLASVGAILGGLTVGRVAPILGTAPLVLITAISLLPAAALGLYAYRLGGTPRGEQEGGAKHGALALDLFARHRVLVHLGLLIVLTQTLSTVLDLCFNGFLAEAIPGQDERTAYLGDFYALLNGGAFFMQFLVTPLILQRVQLRHIHLGIPLIHAVAAVFVIFDPRLFTAAAAYVIFKSLDYSLFRAAKEMLYMPLPYDARYRAKEVIDAFGYRASKGVTAGLVGGISLAVEVLPAVAYPVTALLAACGWQQVAQRATRND
jgi:ATP:ADP antiporter, AAA family